MRLKSSLLAVDAEIVVKHRQRPVGIDGDMQGFMHQVVISSALADYPEVIHVSEVCLPIL